MLTRLLDFKTYMWKKFPSLANKIAYRFVYIFEFCWFQSIWSFVLLTLSIGFFHIVSCSQAYNYAHKTEDNLTSLMPVSQNYSHGLCTTFVFFIKLPLSQPKSLLTFLLFYPCPTGEGSWWKAGWVLSGVNTLHLQNPKLEKEVKHRRGHCCA